MPVSFPNSIDITTYASAAALTAVDTTTFPNGMYAGVTNLGVFQLQKQSSSTVDGTTVIAGNQAATTWNVTYNMHLFEDAFAIIDDSQLGAFSSVNLGNGTAAAPSLAFTSDLTTGLYRAAASTIGFAGAGAMMATLAPTALVLNTGVQISAPSGTAAAPSYTFTGDLNCGIYRVAADQVGVACVGAVVLTVAAAAVTVATGAQVLVPAATVTNPSIIFGGEQTGIYLVSTGVLGMATNGSSKVSLSSTMFSLTGGTDYGVAGTKVVGPRNTGWTTAAGGSNKNAAGINTSTITATDGNMQALANWVKAIADGLIGHGLFGA